MAAKARRWRRFMAKMITILHRLSKNKCIGRHTMGSTIVSESIKQDDTGWETLMNMKTPRLLTAMSCVLLFGSGVAHSHELPDQLGKVTFPTSCDPKVQPLFEAAVAMQHSYWFPEAHKTFNAVLDQDPSCAIAYWGIAVNYL